MNDKEIIAAAEAHPNAATLFKRLVDRVRLLESANARLRAFVESFAWLPTVRDRRHEARQLLEDIDR